MIRTAPLPGVRNALAQAVVRVNFAYSKVDESAWPPVDDERWASLESEIDAAAQVGDAARAFEAIRAWETFAIAQLKAAVEQ